MYGSLEAVEEATFMVFTDLTSNEAPKERRKFFKCVYGVTLLQLGCACFCPCRSCASC